MNYANRTLFTLNFICVKNSLYAVAACLAPLFFFAVVDGVTFAAAAAAAPRFMMI